MIKELFAEVGIELTDEQARQFARYAELLLEYNQKFNLTAITDEREIVIKHFIDSAAGEKYINYGATVIDIGSGAGFPAIPLKIMRPDLKITALDSLNKRVEFIKTVIKELDLTDFEALHLRAEDGGKSKMRETFDAAVARAVAPLSVLCEYALPFVRIGGIFLAYKGGDTVDERAAAKRALSETGGKIAAADEFVLSDGSGRSIIKIEKIAPTKLKYPRGGNKPRLYPL